jgi:hypothetical protein
MKSKARYRINLLVALTIMVSPLCCFAGVPQSGVDAVTQATTSFWSLSYAKLWGVQKDANLLLLRTFREEVLNSTEAGRQITHRLYDNSMELSLLLVVNPALARQARELADELLTSVELRLYTGEAVIRQQAVQDMAALLDQFATKASPKLQGDLGYIREALCAGALLDELNVTVIK